MPSQLHAPHETEPKSEFRLPSNVKPSRYELTLRPDLEHFKVAGHVLIELAVRAPTDCIVLNAVDLGFLETYAESADGTRLNGRVLVDEASELAKIFFDGILGCGKWKLSINFQGVLLEKLKGFYRSTWADNKGETHVVASTHFEPTHARRAFPCFDEPDFKATFKIFLEVDERLTALSNGKELNVTQFTDEQGAKKKRVEFAETMLLSTYLVAFAIGEFVSSETRKVNGTAIRVFTLPGKDHLSEFALDVASYAVEFYERYFECPYPVEKVDHIAIPDFPIGAMENLGLITFRETALLVDRHQSSHAGLVRVAEIIMHELAHMWFGDLVTMQWWNGLWLKESFATFMANVCLNSWKPEWNIWDDFAQSRADAEETDSLESTHAIENPVNHPDEATEMFDVISYQKGCSVLYQLHEFIGAETFRKGCVRYLRANGYGNTETHQLWDALEEAAHEDGLNVPVRMLMDAWVFNAGHPVVTVEPGASRGFLTLRQKLFQLGETNGCDFIFPVPVNMRLTRDDGREEIKKFLMLNREETIFLGEDISSFVVNANGSGFYRVVYDPSLWPSIAENLDHLSTVERYNLINDSWSSVRAGITPASDYLNLIKRYQREHSSGVWQLIFDSLEHISNLFASEDRELITHVILDLAQPCLDELGWVTNEEEAVDTRKRRALIVKLIGVVGNDQKVRAKARELYETWRETNSGLDAELVPSIVQIVAHDGDEELYNEFYRLSREAGTPQDNVRFLYALARFRKQELLARTVSLCLSSTVRSQDAPYLFAAVLRNPHGAGDAWEFLKANFDAMKGRYPDLAMLKMVSALSALDTAELESEVRKFFAHNKVKAGDMAVRQMLEQLHINVRLRQKEAPALKKALAKPTMV